MRNTKIYALSALALVLAVAPASAQGRGHGDDKKHDDKKHDEHPVVVVQHPVVVVQRPVSQDPHKAAIVQKQVAQQRAVQQKQAIRASEQEQHQRIIVQQQRDRAYQQYLAQRTRSMQQESAQLQAARRAAAYRYQQQYVANLRAQQAQINAQRNYNNDPYYYSPYTYRYTRSGTTYQTNQYGADALKRAVNNGYQEGVRAGQADRQDGYRASYTSSFAYQDANYGYDGRYVTQADYNYYFRQGFQRGYQDGYNNATQYGTYNNSSASLLGNIVNNLLGLRLIQ